MAERRATKNLHVPLPADLHEALLRASVERGRPATALVREAIADWLESRRRQAVAEELVVYARAMAGSGADLDKALERAGLEALRRISGREPRS